MMVTTLVIYDIVEDKTRNKIAEVCKDYGLHRIQWSAFMGMTDRNRREELMLKLKRTLGKTEGNIQMFVICEKDLRFKKEINVGSPGARHEEASVLGCGDCRTNRAMAGEDDDDGR